MKRLKEVFAKMNKEHDTWLVKCDDSVDEEILSSKDLEILVSLLVQPMTLDEITLKVGIPKFLASHYLDTLNDKGYIRRVSSNEENGDMFDKYTILNGTVTINKYLNHDENSNRTLAKFAYTVSDGIRNIVTNSAVLDDIHHLKYSIFHTLISNEGIESWSSKLVKDLKNSIKTSTSSINVVCAIVCLSGDENSEDAKDK